MSIAQLELDPLSRFVTTPQYTTSRILDEIGLLVNWAINKPESLTMHDALAEDYGYPMCQIDGVGIDDQGIWSYEGDEDLFPLAKLTCEQEILYIYSYGLVAFIDPDGEIYATRMD
jgi:hypothetical protein